MKKIFWFFISFLILFSSVFYVAEATNCSYENGSLSMALEWCFKNSRLAWTDSENLKIDGNWFQEIIKSWIWILWIFIWIWAVFAIVYSSFILATSAWQDEKISKAKNILKWSIWWFLALIFAATIVTLIIKLFYSI